MKKRYSTQVTDANGVYRKNSTYVTTDRDEAQAFLDAWERRDRWSGDVSHYYLEYQVITQTTSWMTQHPASS